MRSLCVAASAMALAIPTEAIAQAFGVDLRENIQKLETKVSRLGEIHISPPVPHPLFDEYTVRARRDGVLCSVSAGIADEDDMLEIEDNIATFERVERELIGKYGMPIRKRPDPKYKGTNLVLAIGNKIGSYSSTWTRENGNNIPAPAAEITLHISAIRGEYYSWIFHSYNTQPGGTCVNPYG